MSMDVEDHDYNDSPPTLDEGYWESLLSEGEYAQSDHYDDMTNNNSEAYTLSKQDTSDIWGMEQADWAEIQQITENDEIITLNVLGYNRGGLLVEWKSLRGFVPASQLLNFPSHAHPTVRRDTLMNQIGKDLQLRVIELDREKNRLILSERAAQVEAGQRATILSNLQTGDTIQGCITNLCDFGAFVDLGGLEGLIHISELSWGRVGHPNNILERGQHVETYVLDVDESAGRVALSIKRLRPDPWKTVAERYEIGQIVEGIVTNVVDFGAFACIEDGLEGLIHVSELAEGHFLHPRNVVSEEQHVRAKIISIDGNARRLGLSLRID